MTRQSGPAVAEAMGGDDGRVTWRFERGSRCFAAWVGGEVAGFAWVSFGPEWIGELDLEIRPAAGDAYVWNCMVLVPHRRQGIYGSLLRHVVAQGRADRLARLWIASVVGHPAEKADRAAGFVPVLRLSARRALGMRLLTVRTTDQADPALVADARAALSLRGGLALSRVEKRWH